MGGGEFSIKKMLDLLKFVGRCLLSKTFQDFGRKSKNITVLDFRMTMIMLTMPLAGCENVCACEFSRKKLLDIFGNSSAAVCFPRLVKSSEGNQRTSLCLNFRMTMIMLKSVSRDAKMNVLANFK